MHRTHSIASAGTGTGTGTSKKPTPAGPRPSTVSTAVDHDHDYDGENNNNNQLSCLTLSQRLRREISDFQGNYIDQEIFRKLVLNITTTNIDI